MKDIRRTLQSECPSLLCGDGMPASWRDSVELPGPQDAAGGTQRVFDEVYAPSTLGIFLREFRVRACQPPPRGGPRLSGRTRGRATLLPGIAQRAFVDIESLLRPSTDTPSRGRRSGTPRSPGERCCGATGRSWCAATRRSAPRRQSPPASTPVSSSPRRWPPNKRINAAIAAIDEHAWTPVHYPGAIEDPDTAALISDAEVAETLHAARCTAPHAHRAAGGAPGQRRPLPRRPVPGMGGTTRL